MILKQLLEKLAYTCVAGNDEIEINHLVYDSRKVVSGDVFVCISGAVSDGHKYVPDVIERGAAAVVVEKDVVVPQGVAVIRTDNTRKALGCMSAAYFGHPADQLKTIGITGTKGKTTTTYMIKSILDNTGMKTGLIGTIETIIGDEQIPAHNTTPESYVIQESFRRMVDAGCECVVMEVSSQGLMLDRVSGFTFDYGIFTNLEKDHIGPNEHKDFEDYTRCKGLLFKQCSVGIANADDSHLDDVMAGHTCQLETYGLSDQAQLKASEIQLTNRDGKIGISYRISGLMDMDVAINVPGKFSVYNSLSAIALCRHFGIPADKILKALENITVKGRVELIPVSDKYSLMIDYAHNAMALESLLTTLKEYKPKRIVCMFGCGGNRDRNRRFEMGEVSSRLADLTVVTSDNPRFEEPMAIIEDILVGTAKHDGEVVTIPDRKEAIKYCIEHAQEGDVIILAGKGHEDYQEIQGKTYHMDERELIQDILKENPGIEII